MTPRELRVRLLGYANLREGWNSFASCKSISALAIKHAESLSLAAIAQSIPIYHLEPSSSGGVGVTFAHPDGREVNIEYAANGSCRALFCTPDDDPMNAHVVQVPATPAGDKWLLNLVREFLTIPPDFDQRR